MADGQRPEKKEKQNEKTTVWNKNKALHSNHIQLNECIRTDLAFVQSGVP